MGKAREGHVPIPWWAWVAAGAAMALYSRFIDAKTEEANPMILFFWLGVGLAVFGGGKYLLERKKKEVNQDIKQEQKKYQAQLHRQEREQQHQQQREQAQPAQHNIIACPQCRTQNYTHSNFCHKCGMRLK